MSQGGGPQPLSRLDMPVQFLKGVGPRRTDALARMKILTARDLLYHAPRRYDDASTITPIALAEVGNDVTVAGEVRSKGVLPTRSGLRIFQAVVRDDTGIVTCAWPGQPWVDRTLRVGDRILVTGPVRFFHGRQIQPREHVLLSRSSPRPPDASRPSDAFRSPDASRPPERSATPEAPHVQGTIFVVYPASEELPQWFFRRAIGQNLESLLKQVAKEDPLSPDARQALRLPALADALRALHRPASMAQKDEALRRLAFDELFLLQILQARLRHRAARERPGIALVRTNALIKPLHDALPFALTDAQARVLRQIYQDMTSSRRMNRMLQGDVGSGKTVVALFAMLLAVEGGRQAALMAPTGILAEQHAGRIRELLGGLPVGVELLVGSATERRRKAARARVASGEAQLVVGTHALIQDGVEFDALGLAVVDEQHRFGVRQRMALAERDPQPDMLLMSATPIPRSLAMVLHGDLDLSVIDELPPGRRPVVTRVVSAGERAAVLEEVRRRVAQGRQAYLVYPMIEESEDADFRAAEAEFARLAQNEFADRRTALLHGRVPAEKKDEIMRRFQRREIDVLVATTVIEVGIDVPNASVMVVENAERFGLSQLHQLRGRVGRGKEAGLFVMIGGEGVEAGERLDVLARTSDGFEIAREDLRLRGQGDVLGSQQHGHAPAFRFADVLQHQDLIAPAQERARRLVAADPDLAAADNALLRLLLDRRYGDRAKLFGVG